MVGQPLYHLVHRTRLVQHKRGHGKGRPGDREARRKAAGDDCEHSGGSDCENRADPAEYAAELGGLLGLLHLLDGLVDLLHAVLLLRVEARLLHVDTVLGHLGLTVLVVELQIGDELGKVSLLRLDVVRIVKNGDVGRAKRLLFADSAGGRVVAARNLHVRSRKNLKGLALDVLGLGVVVRDLGELVEHGFRGLRVRCLCV